MSAVRARTEDVRADGPSRVVRGFEELVACVDGLGADATGDLRLETSSRSARVSVARGRVLHVSCEELEPHFTGLLAVASGLADRVLEAHVKLCRDQGIPLGEHLLRQGFVRRDELASATRVHAVECLTFLAHEPVRVRWTPSAKADADADADDGRTTFSGAELLVEAMRAVYGEFAVHVASEWATLFRDGEWAAAFAPAHGRGRPELVATRGDTPAVGELLAMGEWAERAIGLSAPSMGDALLAFHRTTGKAILAFVRHGALVVGEVPHGRVPDFSDAPCHDGA
ncbi:MAG: hypothetical protein U0169_09410 [Polyangiaceae bacterium]